MSLPRTALLAAVASVWGSGHLHTAASAALIPASPATKASFLQDVEPESAVVIYFGDDEAFLVGMRDLAARYSGARLKWVHASGDEFGTLLAKGVGLGAAEFPELVLWKFGEAEDYDEVVRLSKWTLEKAPRISSIEELAQRWETGALFSESDGSLKPRGKGAEPAAALEGEFLALSPQRGVWVFDDAAAPKQRGQPLSGPMLRSEGGHTLVEMGSIGLLLGPGGDDARVVRWFDSLEAAKISTQPAVAPKAESQSPDKLSCPSNADIDSCKDWCEGVLEGAMDWRHSLGGRPCSALPSLESLLDRPSCMCYDADFKVLHAMCASPCTAQPSKEAQASATCSAGAGSACSAGGQGQDDLGRRFVLYDTKYGEGFNLQREVYPRAGWVVAQLNKAMESRCGSQSDGECTRWTLVLPPWCRVVHWWSGPEPLPWSTFFDAEALRSSKVPVIEFEEYSELVGGAEVDLAVVYAADKFEGRAGEQLTGAQGKFAGWAADLHSCASTHRKLPDFQTLPAGKSSLTYAGQCEGDIRARDLRCASLDGPWPEGIVDMISSLSSATRSVLLKGYDYLLSPDARELDTLGLRESMLFAADIRQRAEQFITQALGGGPYLAAHCRRTDFLRAREKTTPTADAIAARLNLLLEETGLTQVLVATDAPDDLRQELQRQVRSPVHFFDASSGVERLTHPGKQAAAEIWIAARADYFIGTIESRFTMAIQLERGFLGKAPETSEQEFCKNFEGKDQKKCLAPKYRHPGRRGAGRSAYV